MNPLGQLVVLFLVAVIAVPLFKRLGLGALLGYIAAGMLIGPYGLGVVGDVDNMMHISEFGVVLLMFVIGLELQFSRLRALRKPIFGLGTLQVLSAMAVIGGLILIAGNDVTLAIVLSCGLALSSTAFVLQLLAEKRQLATGHGRLAFTILLFQDMAAVPMLAFLPFLATGGDAGDTSWQEFLLDAGRILLVFGGIVIAGRYLLRHCLRFIHAARVREVSIAAALLVVSGTAYLMDLAGLSMALGAFVAGVLLADSEFRHQLEADIEPFKGLLLGLFFISVGMTLNLNRVLTDPFILFACAAGLMLIKALLIAAIGHWGGKLSGVSAFRLGLLLSQGGEFGFVIFSLAGQLDLIDRNLREQLVAVVTISMMLTPLVLFLFERLVARFAPDDRPPFDDINDGRTGAVIAGFGRFGQISGRVLGSLKIPFTALDVNPEQVDVVRRFGNEVHYGDASQIDVLNAARVGEAKVFILAIDDIDASIRAAHLVRQNFPDVRILARARNRRHAHLLMDAGVRWLVRETYHSALFMAEEMLVGLGKERKEARELIGLFRDADERNLVRQHGLHDDPAKILQSAKEAAEELRQLFEQDQEERGRD
ncbi:monovalent cation:proton antiporter-2 (CPA2) family protein [Marinobacter nanhaiticus D15-8W]|uniref:Glutathione-regulated potassium-efflux system protein KefB n=1 Tax=Marinobacter nanhaiticus D15-8W TaxID=626887 RepID=N6WV01_9GAMM|nr:monovalent cation:proton antiporter-2 (CPA2) family protein [Marinobacter nanhaiticus]ENO12658.1 glutathione-regulated potassium-efflux system protein KefB [Marinobacter nanhaiticus D15-8W]BES69996.1 monovalent cation:proton antiporter-2 (CPA2) family protein [Marinobacter nanhaiticus D15-8W]